jgi:hypothetical protein
MPRASCVASIVLQEAFAMHTTSFLRAARVVFAATWLSAPSACSDDEPNRTARTAGGENAFDRAGRKIDKAHQNFKREVKPAAQVVDEKTKKVVGEVKKAVKKGADAVEDAAE